MMAFAVLLVACSKKPVPQQTTSQQYIEQDAKKAITGHPEPPFKNQPAPQKAENKPAVPAQVAFTHDDNRVVGEWLDSLQSKNLKVKYAKGFRIQLYVGADRDVAFKAKETAYKLLKGDEVYMTYTLPTFKVQVGDYMDRIEAEHAFRTIRGRYPDALIVHEKIIVQR